MSTVTIRESRSLFSRLGNARLQVVAPCIHASLPQAFACIVSDSSRYDETIDRIQLFRGRIYREDGAIPPDDLSDFEYHRCVLDRQSWHLLITGEDDRILACLRYTHFVDRPITLHHLHLTQMMERAEPATASKLNVAVRGFLEQVNRRGAGLGEIGGWAAGAEARNSIKGLLLACACWSFGELLADPFGIATATSRHHSAEILRRLGGFGLCGGGEELPPFYDAYHGCTMQVMGFSIPSLAPLYRSTVDDVTRYLRKVPVLIR